MSEQQSFLPLDAPYAPAPAVVPAMRDEIAGAWGLPLGERVEVCFRGSERAATTGVMELLSTPEFPWNPREVLKLRIAGFNFTSREIERWTRL